MVTLTQLSIELRVQIEILFDEGYSQEQIAKKLKISIYEVQYLLQRRLKTVSNIDRNKSAARKVTRNRRNRNKTAPD